LTAAIISDKGRAAARSGLGAVMGAKRLKAVVAAGRRPVPLSDPGTVLRLRKEVLAKIKAGFGSSEFLRTTGTPGYVRTAVQNGDAPIKNWAGTPEDFPNAETLAPAALDARRAKRYSCRMCAIGCGGFWPGESEKGGRLEHRPEYETIAAFGPLCLNRDVDAIARANSICNRYGLDTVSTGAAVAFAIDCFGQGYLTSKDLGGLDLRWGDGPAIVSLTEMIARREGFGAILADGLQVAQTALHGQADLLAVHVRGEALPMHDPRYEPGLAAIYALDPTPARHTQANQMEIPHGLDWKLPARDELQGRGRLASRLSALTHVVNCSGMCLFGFGCMTVQDFAGFLAAVTGLQRGVADLEAVGMQIAGLRQEFNRREGIDLSREPFPGRALGIPPAEGGPWKGVSLDLAGMAREFMEAMGWRKGAGSGE
jgi:aldehyde:ferredoxin oxidoreductase